MQRRANRRVRAAGLLANVPAWLVAGSVIAAELPTTVIAVRHAEKAAGQGKDPHLTEAGRARAAALADLLPESAAIGALYSSEFHRTRETLAPLAERTGLAIRTVPAAETDDRLSVDFLRAEHPGRIVVVAGHSNTIPALVEALTGVPTPELDESVYDALWVVSLHPDGGSHAVRFRYGASAD